MRQLAMEAILRDSLDEVTYNHCNHNPPILKRRLQA